MHHLRTQRQSLTLLPPPDHAAAAAPEAHICVVVRTYVAHGPAAGTDDMQPQPGPLRQLVESLRRSGHQAWQLQMVVVDDRPFAEAERMVAELGDPRVTLHPSKARWRVCFWRS